MEKESSLLSVAKLYLIYLERPADPEGLLYWANELENKFNGDVASIARNIGSSLEIQKLLGLPTNDIGVVIDKIYNNVFGRNPDAEGRAYWVSAVNEGRVIIPDLPYQIATGAGVTDKATFQTKEAAARLFTEIIDGRNFADPNFGKPPFKATFDGRDTEAARSFLAKVTDKVPTVEEVRANIIENIANIGDQLKPSGVLGTTFEQNILSSIDINSISDPLFKSQWYLKNNGDRGASAGLDVNIAGAWADGYTGKGIRIAVNDDGIDINHSEFQNILLKDLTFNSATKVTGANAYTAGNGGYNPDAEANEHGTVVGSIVAMALDGKGMVGMAPNANLVSSLAVSKGSNVDVPAIYNYMTDVAKVDVSVNSYGLDPAFSENFWSQSPNQADRNYLAAIEKAGQQGRGGLGTVVEVSAGNEGPAKADAAMTGSTNNKYIITAGAMNEFGNKATYSTPGASVLVSSFGGENPDSKDQSINTGFGVTSADISGATLGYNKTDSANGDYSFQNTGTSYSGPMVGAAAALMLQANPLLGFRDVANILALTARAVGTTNNYITTKGDGLNFGGMQFSRDVGFGLIDVSAAVRLAASWTDAAKTAANWVSSEAKSDSAAATISDTGTTVTANLTKNVIIERMEFDLNLTTAASNDLKAVITSPNGTTITLFDEPMVGKDAASAVWPGTFQIGATAFFGEQSAGTWTLQLIDKNTGTVAEFKELTVRAWGSDVTADNHYVLADSFTGSKTVNDASGTDLIDAAAVSSAVTINLNAGQTSTIAGGTFVIAAGVQIENAFGGAGNDTLIGNDVGNVLRGNGGADTLTGNGGADVFMFATVNDSKTSSRDTITDFVVGTDKIDLRLLDANLKVAGNQSFSFAGQRGDVVSNSASFSFVDTNTILKADMDGDAIADIEIVLVGQKQLTINDFLGVEALAA